MGGPRRHHSGRAHCRCSGAGQPDCPRTFGNRHRRSARMAIELVPDLAVPSPEFAQEAKIAIHDILERNWFRPLASPGGPYRLMLGTADNRLLFDIRLADFSNHGRLLLSLIPFRHILKEY